MDLTGHIPYSNMHLSDIKVLIERGENDSIEFKQTVPSPDKIAREICALANTRGGIIFVGVSDHGELVGIRDYFEEEFWIRQGAEDLCMPAVEVRFEVIEVKKRDILLVHVSESERKPVFLKHKKKRVAFIRQHEENVVASPERLRLMAMETRDTEITFEYGAKEQRLFQYLREYGEISAEGFAKIAGISATVASRTLAALVKTGTLSVFFREKQEYFCFTVSDNKEPHTVSGT